MSVDLSAVKVSVTKPRGKPARMLAEMGIRVVPIPEDEGNVDRYVLSKRLAVERRTGSSFLRGIMDKTLFTSAIYLREHFRLPVLVVEGEVNYEYSAFNPQAVRGALTAMVIEYGMTVLATPNVEETVALIAMMARQEQLGIPEISLIPKRKATDLADMQRRVVEMLPGCGMVVAREMLQHFGSVAAIVGAGEEELRAVRGIGARKARQIRRVLGADYEAVDTERNLEDAIEVCPQLLFERPVTLLARQHYVFSDEGGRNFVDMVFHDPGGDEAILVELKRGRVGAGDVTQLRRYLDQASGSKLLRELLDGGSGLRGVLATVEPSDLEVEDPDITLRVVDRQSVIEVLKVIREERRGVADGPV
jgi:ERCC4-type nuclease